VLISVVVPVLNEEPVLAGTLASARAPGVKEIIVADGGSDDRSVAVARRYADRVIDAPRGRATQMNAGARLASGGVLLFLHADTILPHDFDAAIQRALADPRLVGGRFDVALEPSSPLLALTAKLINLRSRLSRIATGDQAIFVRREIFNELGGFPAVPLMEDVALSRALKRRGRIACLRQRVITSSRRWRKHGVWRTIALMWTLRLLYFVGVSPTRLERVYAETR
jgi:rSAM/selenodomain-associated transferase 2